MKNLILKIDRPAYGGVSISRHNGRIVIIKGPVLPGETVEITIENEKKDYISASALKVLGPSPDRAKPLCMYFGECGGCHFQHITYDRQVRLKEDILRDCLKRMAKIETALSGPIISKNPWHYRLRGQFKSSRGSIGFYKENTREVVDIDRCLLMTEEINIKELHITSGEYPIALIKAPVLAVPGAEREKLARAFFESGFSGLFIETLEHPLIKFGVRHITLDLDGIKYTVSPVSFFQSNWDLNQTAAEFIKSNLLPLKGKKILDLYAGAGNFSLPLAMDAEVTAVEENTYAVEDGRRNLEINNIRNCRFIHSSAEGFRPKNRFDIVLLDPPRPGLSKKAMSAVLELTPAVIVYISCNPATFARDLKKLLIKYDIESLRMIDFFPQTYHIEALAFLRLR
ncbi:MAG: class I SAM-dependent RNA methyltransferase [Nitrospirae bacterium]|nr:class I SAM-dependent RNA methyltransferase [Nitrospirota bacterium]